NDTLIGGAGNDTLTGGGHNDHFVFSGAFGNDIIMDMNEGSDIRDVIEINGFGSSFDSFDEISPPPRKSAPTPSSTLTAIRSPSSASTRATFTPTISSSARA